MTLMLLYPNPSLKNFILKILDDEIEIKNSKRFIDNNSNFYQQ